MVTLKELLAGYGQLSRGDRLHMLIRWRVCPMPRIASYVPERGAILDLGCGHGLFTQLLARSAAAREVIGIDLDAEKIAVAQTLVLPNLRFLAEDLAATDVPPAQAVTILDVFYLIPFDLQEKLLADCAQKLAPGGVIVLKEMAEAPRWKVFLNWLEESLAVRVLHITDQSGGGKFYFRTRSEWQAVFKQLGFQTETISLDRGYYHPHVLFIGRREPPPYSVT